MSVCASQNLLPRLVCDVETALVDGSEGVRAALLAILPRHRHHGVAALSTAEFQQRPLPSLLAQLAGVDTVRELQVFARDYWQAYAEFGRWQAQLRPDARALLETCRGAGIQLVYLAHCDAAEAARIVSHHELTSSVSGIVAPPQPMCPLQRGGLLRNLIESRPFDIASLIVASDCAPEVQTAQQLRLPTLAIGYGATAPARWAAFDRALPIARSPADLWRWIDSTLAVGRLMASARTGLRSAPRSA